MEFGRGGGFPEVDSGNEAGPGSGRGACFWRVSVEGDWAFSFTLDLRSAITGNHGEGGDDEGGEADQHGSGHADGLFRGWGGEVEFQHGQGGAGEAHPGSGSPTRKRHRPLEQPVVEKVVPLLELVSLSGGNRWKPTSMRACWASDITRSPAFPWSESSQPGSQADADDGAGMFNGGRTAPKPPQSKGESSLRHPKK